MSSWTTSGTVSVTNNSKKVYGAGTPWVSNGKTRAGDEFIAPNGARHEVESVQSNTELTLVEPYMGAPASGQTYALLHIGLLPAELAVAVSEMTAKNVMAMSQLFDWQTSTAASVPLTNPATQVTSQVKPIAGLIADIGAKAPSASPEFTGDVTTEAGKSFRTIGSDSGLDLGFGSKVIRAAADGRLVLQSQTGIVDCTGMLLVTNSAGLGYGDGSGASVVQATSKSTDVTLNKPSGRITMHASAIPAESCATFRLNNECLGENDSLVVNIDGASMTVGHWVYSVVLTTREREAFISVWNLSGASLSEAVVLKFNLVKGAAS